MTYFFAKHTITSYLWILQAWHMGLDHSEYLQSNSDTQVIEQLKIVMVSYLRF